MRRFVRFGQRLPLWVVVIVPLLVFALACGPGEEATPTPTTAAPTPTSEGPVASPTPTTEAPPVATATIVAQRGGTFRHAEVYTPSNWDPHINPFIPNGWYTQPLSNNIIFNPRGATLVCEICETDQWALENGGKTIVINMKQGILWHDGTELTSADVKHTLRKIMGEVDGVVSPRCGVMKEYIESVEAPSRYQVKINTIRPAVGFLMVLFQFTQCSLVQNGATKDTNQAKLVGTGPFILKEYLPKSTVKYVPNPNYFKKGLPYFDELVIYWGADQNATFTAFLANRTDWFYWCCGAPIQFEPDIARLKAEGKIIVRNSVSTVNSGVYLNHSRPPFNDLKMRQAVNLAIDRRDIGTTIRLGDYKTWLWFHSDVGLKWGRPESEIWGVLPGWAEGAAKAAEIQKAKQLVIDAGYASGVEAEYVSANPNELYISILAGIGIRTRVKQAATTQEQDQLITNLQFDYAVSGLTQITIDPDEWFLSYFLTGGSRNWYGYSNPKFDQLAIQVSSELDYVKRKQLVRQAEQVLLDDVAAAPVPGGKNWEYWYPYLKGVGEEYVIPWEGTNMWRFEDWWFDESLR